MATIPTTYSYKVYKNGAFLGELEDVTSPFSYSQVINSAGAEMRIDLQTNVKDIGSTIDTDNLVDESGNQIVTEDGFDLLLRSSYSFATVPINAGNDVVVTEFSSDNPNGVVVFNGIIFEWSGDTANGTISLRVVGNGIELDNYIIQSGESVLLSQTTSDTTRTLFIGSYTKIAQTFTATNTTPISAVDVKLTIWAFPGQATISVYDGDLTNDDTTGRTLMSTVSRTGLPVGAATTYKFSFPPFTPVASSVYTIVFELGADDYANGADVDVAGIGSSAYAGGNALLWDGLGMGPVFSASGTYSDLYFTVYSSTGSTTAPYLNTDPADMLRSILDDYQNQGGNVSYSATSIDDTDEAPDYTFKINTVLEGVRKVQDLSPAYWYWFVDPATNLMHLHDTAVTSHHTFVQGQHIENFIIGQSLAAVKNIVYFSGGDIGGGVNLFRLTEDRASITELGSQWLERISDNRVTLNDTADRISASKIKVLGFDATLTVLARTYDISTILPGQMIAIRNYDALIDSILMQVIGYRRSFDRVELQLGTPQPRTSKAIDNIDRRVQLLETIDNPSAPT